MGSTFLRRLRFTTSCTISGFSLLNGDITIGFLGSRTVPRDGDSSLVDGAGRRPVWHDRDRGCRLQGRAPAWPAPLGTRRRLHGALQRADAVADHRVGDPAAHRGPGIHRLGGHRGRRRHLAGIPGRLRGGTPAISCTTDARDSAASTCSWWSPPPRGSCFLGPRQASSWSCSGWPVWLAWSWRAEDRAACSTGWDGSPSWRPGSSSSPLWSPTTPSTPPTPSGRRSGTYHGRA